MEYGTYARREITDPAIQNILNPAVPLGERQDRYIPRINRVRNMVLLSAGVWLMILGAMLFVSLVNGRTVNVLVIAPGAAAGLAVLGVMLYFRHRDKKAGGDLNRCGLYLLEDGLLCADRETALWIPREQVEGFSADRIPDREGEGFQYRPVISGGEVVVRCALDSMHGLEEAHSAQLRAWREDGSFSYERWLYGEMPENGAEEEDGA